jgi:hypothetical protein
MNSLSSFDFPEKFYRITETQLSISRYSGGCIYNGKYYVYNPIDDTLIREDIFKKEQKSKKTKKVKNESAQLF